MDDRAERPGPGPIPDLPVTDFMDGVKARLDRTDLFTDKRRQFPKRGPATGQDDHRQRGHTEQDQGSQDAQYTHAGIWTKARP